MRNLIFIFFFLGLSLIQAKTIVITHDSGKIAFSKIDSFDHIEYTGILNGAPLANKPGAPDLPVYIYRLTLEEGQTIQSFSIVNLQQEELSGLFNIDPLQRLWSQETKQTTVHPDPVIYNQVKPYPQAVVKFLGVQHFNGKPIAHFAIYPFQYVPAQKKILFNKYFEIEYNTKDAVHPNVKPYFQADQSSVSGLVNQQTGNHLFAQKQFPLPEPTDAIDPELLSSGLIDRYVIITTDKLKEAFEPLAEWKTKRGVPTVIRTIEWILAHFSNGVDDAERMRNFIRWSYQKRGTRYVLLGGDTEIIPTRLIHTGNFTFAADYYFSDLDGTWNANQNDIFGQADDEVEAYPEVYVGRVPVLEADDVQRFIYKLFRYEKLDSVHTPGYPANALYLAANLQKVDDSRDLIMKHIDPQINPKFSRTLLTQSRDIGSDPQVPLNALNQSYGIVFSENHGLYFTIRPGAKGSDLYDYNIKELTTPDPPIWYMASCYTNDILKRSISEVYLRSKSGGGVAYIGNSSWEYPFSGVYLEKEFFNLAFNKGYYHLSEAHYLSRLPYLGYLNFEGPSRIIVFSTIVLGDPEMPIWTERPENLAVNYQLQEDRTRHVLNVTVNEADSAALPVAQADVVLYKKGDLYRILRTDASGHVSFDVTGINLDSVNLTVSKHNYRPYEGMVRLFPMKGFAAKLSGFTFKQVRGNGNNQAEPGEQFDLYLTWQNTGSASIPVESPVVVKNDSPFYTFENTAFYLQQALKPGDSVRVGPFKCNIGSNILTDTTLTVPVTLSNLSDFTAKGKVEFSVFVPRLIIAMQETTTLAGEDSSENISTIVPHIQNIGRGMAYQIHAQLFSDDSLVKILVDTLFMAQLAPGESKPFNKGFAIITTGDVENVHLRATYRDRSGLQWTFPVNLSAPEPPLGVCFRTDNEKGILLSWLPDSGAQVLGYNIYRTESLQKPFERINQIPVLSAGYFVDTHIQNGKSYFYALQTVDSSGNLSSLSDTLHAWSALPYQQGFPVRPNVKAIGSEVSGVTCFDFNGDGKKELIASGGNGQLHLYDDQGNLLWQADGMAGDLTFPAVGNVTGSKDYEIVVSGFKEGQPENNIYVIDSQNGNILSRFNLHYNAPSPVVLADLDHDGLDEILVLTHGANAPEPPKESRLFILRDSSGVLVGFKDWPTEGLPFSGDNTSLGNVAIADLDNSGMMSVLVPTLYYKLYCFNPDTSVNPAWVTTLSGGYLMAPISVADLNHDGYKEMVVASVKNDKLYVIDHTGNFFPGWEGGKDVQITDPYGHSSPAIIGNVDDDPDLEILYVGRHNIYVFDPDGTLKPGWPMAIDNGGGYYEGDRDKLPPYNSPVLGDVNQDGIQDLVYLDAYGFIHALSLDDQHEIIGFPIFTNNDRVNAQSPVLDDIDGDGDLDILTVNHEGVLMVWDAPQKYQESTFLYWNQPLANARHTGVLDTLHLSVISAIQNNTQAKVPQQFYLRPNYPNPFNPQTTIEFGLKEPALVRLTIFNILGQKIATLYNNRLLSKGIHRTRWNGKNDAGIDQASGIYFMRLTVKNKRSGQIYFTKTNKMIKLK